MIDALSLKVARKAQDFQQIAAGMARLYREVEADSPYREFLLDQSTHWQGIAMRWGRTARLAMEIEDV